MPVEKALSEGASQDLSELDWLQKINSAYQTSFTEAYNQKTILLDKLIHTTKLT